MVPASTAHARLAGLHFPGMVWIGSRPVEPVRRLPTDIADIDAMLGGGLPRGRLSEIVGPLSSGRTALVWSAVAAATRRGELAAVIDVENALDPASLEGAGAGLVNVLWVRPRSIRNALKCAEWVLDAGDFGTVALDLGASFTHRLPASVWLRLARAAQRSGSVFTVAASHEVAGSFAFARLVLARRSIRWASGRPPLLDGFVTRVNLARGRGASRIERCVLRVSCAAPC